MAIKQINIMCKIYYLINRIIAKSTSIVSKYVCVYGRVSVHLHRQVFLVVFACVCMCSRVRVLCVINIWVELSFVALHSCGYKTNILATL